jgi:hypothetical protein
VLIGTVNLQTGHFDTRWNVAATPAGNQNMGIAAFTPSASTCYGNCDASTSPPILNVADFTCFLQKFSTGDPYANCDHSTASPTLNVQDFTCFLQKFAQGCS